jgi:Gpi18-like mannosyltransferase
MLINALKNQKNNLKLLAYFSAVVLAYEALILLAMYLFNFKNFLSFTGWEIFKNSLFYFLVRWDSWLFLDIIQNGYTAGLTKIFPLYPLSVAFFNLFIGNAIVAGFLVSWASLAGALFFLWKLFNLDNSREVSKKALLLLLFFPSAVFFSTIYSESLFLFLIVAFFYYLKKNKWLPAAIFGLLAALTRHVGIFLFAVYLWHYWETFRSLPLIGKSGKEKLPEKIKLLAFSLLIPLGTAAYALFCYLKFGNPLSFAAGETSFDSCVFSWPWNTFASYFNSVFTVYAIQTNFYYFFRAVIIEGLSFVLLLAATVYFFLKKENLYGLFCLLNLGIISTMFPLVSSNRYVAVVFPIYLFLARLVKNESVFFFLLALFIIFFAFTVHLFGLGNWAG